ncbi:hypothetical protein P5V15_005891 [Pogonomyrmex californicus]
MRLQVYLGNAVVSNHHGVAHLYAVNSSDEDIELAIPTVKIYPFEEIREEIKENFNNKRDNDNERINKILQLLRLDHLNEEVTSATSLVTSHAERFHLPGEPLGATNVFKH